MSQKQKNKKQSRKQEESSSSSDSENETDSSSTSSQSQDSSPTPKKSKKESKEEVRKDKSTKHGVSSNERDLKRFKKQSFDEEGVNKPKHNTVEQSRWDSPKEKLERRDKKSERYRRSDSTEREHFKSKNRIEKKHEPEDYHKDYKYDRSREYNSNKNEERYRPDRRGRRFEEKEYQNERYEKKEYQNERYEKKEYQNERYEKKEYQNERYERKDRRNDRDEYYKDKNQRERGSRMDENHTTKRYSYDRSNSADQSKNRSNSHQNKYRHRNHRSRSRSLDGADTKWGKGENDDKSKSDKPKEKPNFGLSGKLTEETNTYRGIVIKYSEPLEARKPKRRWRLYPFKGEKALQTLYIHRESAYLIGRERKIVDLPVDHPSCSKQHAVLQYRLVPFMRDDGSQGKKVRPYIIDLDSANGTFINNKKIDSRKYVELLEKDVIKFGYSSREYVLLHENSKDEAQDDDVKEEEVYEPVKTEKE